MPSEAAERRAARAAQMGAALPPVDNDPLPCPRCESTNTKFCYYNNYNFSQPRHFCKSCRRYWTHGGTLRDIPIGGGSRKTAKRSRTCSPSSSSATSSAATSSAVSVGGPIFVSLSSSASTATVAPPAAANSFTSLLSTGGPGILALGGFGLGLEDVGFGLGRGVWGFPEVGSMSGGVAGAGVGVGDEEMDGNRGDTWQVETGESEFGVSGDCFPSFPGLAISTPGNALK